MPIVKRLKGQRRKRLNDKDRMKLKKMYLKGNPLREIARELRVSERAISYQVQKMGLKRDPFINLPTRECGKKLNGAYNFIRKKRL